MLDAPPCIHPTAIIDPAAQLANGVTVGPFAVIEGPVTLGPGCVVRARAHLIGPITAGAGNDFGLNCAVGERAQHILYQDDPGEVVIGEHNVFRECVTIHRGTPERGTTRIGSHSYLMCCTHVAHDCTLGDHCIFANGAVIGGHVAVGDRAFLSGNTGVHQYCRVGRLAMLSASAVNTNDQPPFSIVEGRNHVAGVNLVGMRRAGLTAVQIQAVRQAYRLLLQSRELLRPTLARIEKEWGHVDLVAELVAFIRESKRGVCLSKARRHREASAGLGMSCPPGIPS
jgi:UDP-N-acetylglucosamine acyltransferase